MNIPDFLKKCTGFEWDVHNADKNRNRHGVSTSECEQVFFNLPLAMADDGPHSQTEIRFYALGQTDERRLLFVAFTVRQNKIQVISARDMSRKERSDYASLEEKKNPHV